LIVDVCFLGFAQEAMASAAAAPADINGRFVPDFQPPFEV
jgi:hypothetical protein